MSQNDDTKLTPIAQTQRPASYEAPAPDLDELATQTAIRPNSSLDGQTQQNIPSTYSVDDLQIVTKIQAETSERRLENRYQIEMRVSIGDLHPFYLGQSQDLSSGGLFLATQSMLPIGSDIHLTLWLPDNSTLQAHGRVRWQRPARGEDPAGVGIAFVRLSENAKQRIQKIIQAQTDAGIKPLV